MAKRLCGLRAFAGEETTLDSGKASGDDCGGVDAIRFSRPVSKGPPSDPSITT